MKASLYGRFAAAMPDLHDTALGPVGKCPGCGKALLTLKPTGGNSFEPSCAGGCSIRQITDAVTRIITNGTQNGSDTKVPSETPKSEEKKARFTFLTRDEVREQEPPAWQWGKRIVKGSLVAIYGKSDACKTFLAMDGILTMLKGIPWCGQPMLNDGAAVYINADSGHGFSKRLVAWEAVNGADHEHELYVINERVNFTHMGEIIAFGDAMAELPEGPSVVVVDTLARCYQGSENDADQMGFFVAGCDYLRVRFGCTVIVIHHMGVTAERERGSSALRAAADTMIEVSREERHVKVHCDKQRDAEAFDDLHFELTPVDDTESAILVPIDEPLETPRDVKRHKRSEMLFLISETPGLTCEEIADELGVSARTVRRYKDELIQQGRITEKELPRQPGQEGVAPGGLFLGSFGQ